MKPKHTEYHCDKDCPFIEIWEHPYWHHTAWCWKQFVDLSWYDYWIAHCIDNKPDFISKYPNSGRTKPPTDSATEEDE